MGARSSTYFTAPDARPHTHISLFVCCAPEVFGALFVPNYQLPSVHIFFHTSLSFFGCGASTLCEIECKHFAICDLHDIYLWKLCVLSGRSHTFFSHAHCPWQRQWLHGFLSLSVSWVSGNTSTFNNIKFQFSQFSHMLSEFFEFVAYFAKAFSVIANTFYFSEVKNYNALA